MNIFSFKENIHLVDQLLPRVLGNIDCDPHSFSYGSCDRNYWMYKIRDFNSGILQQSSLSLAIIVKLLEKEKSKYEYLSSKNINFYRGLSLAINKFTLKQLHSQSGLLDEYYPGEQSFPASVFASYALIKSASILNQTAILNSTKLGSIADNFIKRSSSAAANQDMASAAFLHLYGKVTQRLDCKNKAIELIQRKNLEGEFLEYGGIDLGYASVSLNYLSYAYIDGLSFAKKPINNLAEYLAQFISHDGHFGGDFPSRNTTYFLPFGLCLATKLNPTLSERIKFFDIKRNFKLFDDRYLMHYSYPSLCQSSYFLKESQLQKSIITDSPKEQSLQKKIFIDKKVGHLFAINHKKTHIAGSFQKGGLLQIIQDSKATFISGYRIKIKNKIYSTGHLTRSSHYKIQIQNEESLIFTSEASFSNYKIITPSPSKTILLRYLSFAGPWLNILFKKLLIKDAVILPRRLLIRRVEIDLKKNSLIVQDRITELKKEDRLFNSPPLSFRLVPSAKFYQSGIEKSLILSELKHKGGVYTYSKKMAINDN